MEHVKAGWYWCRFYSLPWYFKVTVPSPETHDGPYAEYEDAYKARQAAFEKAQKHAHVDNPPGWATSIWDRIEPNKLIQ